MAKNVATTMHLSRTATDVSAEPHPRVAADSRRSFDQLVGDEQQRVTRLVYRLLGWSGEVDDVVQDVFLSAFRAWPKFRQESRASTWLSRIAVNACRSHIRRKRFRLRLFRADEGEAEVTATEPAAVDSETVATVRSAIGELPQKYREVVVLYYLEQQPVADIAEMLATRPNTIEVRLSRARGKLKERLGESV